ncbi:hypothetical protein EF912_25895 [Streptomyces sp. WAC07061]|uniref:hypothetical protein n=1 Tax=Streptomyces sp. WAC07061 TaxID=2487410 RepID=UPI000F7954FF|nr:hypothetical protein [Streptomyces sp. WAC07061]RSS47918.1 hypothetical protein EF912_25895 [Streptomyces sp. WAC07061]
MLPAPPRPRHPRAPDPASARPRAVPVTGHGRWEQWAGSLSGARGARSAQWDRVFDAAGVVPGAGCHSIATSQVNCGPVGTTSRLRMAAGDGNDTVGLGFFVPLPVAAVIDGGTGQDRLRGGSRGDQLSDPDGWPVPQAQNSFVGGGGNDTIISRNRGYDRIDCGDGFDTVIADPAARDVVVNCENVIRL